MHCVSIAKLLKKILRFAFRMPCMTIENAKILIHVLRLAILRFSVTAVEIQYYIDMMESNYFLPK